MDMRSRSSKPPTTRSSIKTETMGAHVQAITITIPREAVELRNPFPVVDILESWIPCLCDRNRNLVEFEVLGYEEDSRELYDIPEVREYFRELYNRHFGLFYWINVNSPMLLFLGLMFYPALRREGTVSLFGSDLLAYLRMGFYGLKIFCSRYNLAIDPSKAAILRALDFLDPPIQPGHTALMVPIRR